jgi:hypothetical protein
MRMLYASAIVLALTAGCSRSVPRGQVAGRVSMRGQGLPRVQVLFMPDPGQPAARAVTGITDADGHYQLGGSDGLPGVVAGHYHVYLGDLQWSKQPFFRPLGKSEDRPAPPQAKTSRIPDRYAGAAESPLKYDVASAKQTIDLVLEP